MVFLNQISMKSAPLPEGYPFNLPIIESFEQLEFRSPVTFLVGENGSGKSTLLEAMAVGLILLRKAGQSHMISHSNITWTWLLI